MSLIKSIMHQLGISGDPAKNFTLSVPAAPDGTMKLARGNAGATTQDILMVEVDGKVNLLRGTVMQSLSDASGYSPAVQIFGSGTADWARMDFKSLGAAGAARLEQYPTGEFSVFNNNKQAISIMPTGIVAFPSGRKTPFAQFGLTYAYNSSAQIASNVARSQFPFGYSINGLIDPDGIVYGADLTVTPKKAGYYLVILTGAMGSGATSFVGFDCMKNGTTNMVSALNVSGDTAVEYLQASVSRIVQMNGTTDFLQPWIRVGTPAGGNVSLADAGCNMSVVYLGD